MNNTQLFPREIETQNHTIQSFTYPTTNHRISMTEGNYGTLMEYSGHSPAGFNQDKQIDTMLVQTIPQYLWTENDNVPMYDCVYI